MDLTTRDLERIWHPCSQMKDYESFKPLEVESANGPYITLSNGQKIIDAISSWWCKSLGHGHPRIRSAAIKQMEKFEHVIFANTTNQTIVELSEKLTSISPGLNKVFYGGDGSTVVEIAMKMCLHAQSISGNNNRTQFAALEHGYHGESAAALGASSLGLYKEPYRHLLPDVYFIKNIPYVSRKGEPLWHNCGEDWVNIESQLNKRAGSLAGILVEPIVQGAGGMLIYSADFLKRLRKWCTDNSVMLIADEIMTGFGRTGKTLACKYAEVEPDFACLSKGLTSGWIPFSCVLTSSAVYDLFYDDYESGKSFLHSNTYTGNALGAAIALETLKIYEDDNVFEQVLERESSLITSMEEVASKTGCLKNIRGIGCLAAGDLILPPERSKERVGYKVFQEAVKAGALLRPLGNTIYWMPPLNTDEKVIDELKNITIQAVKKVL